MERPTRQAGEGLDTKAEVSVSSGSAVAPLELDTSTMMPGLVSPATGSTVAGCGTVAMRSVTEQHGLARLHCEVTPS